MVKFNLRIFKSCQTKPSSPPSEHSSPPPCQHHKQITGDPQCPTSPSPSPHRSSFKTHVVDKLYVDVVSPRSKVSNSDNNDHGFRFPLPPVPPFYQRKNRRTRKTKSNAPKNNTVSSAYSHRFSTSGDGEKSPEIVSHPRRSFSDVGVGLRHEVDGGGEVLSPEWGSPTRLSVFKKCKVEGKVKESFAVVKRSEKPFEDFKKSMMEMIVENQMYDDTDLKQLLQCFLSLNSWHHHAVIIEVFSEIWNTMHVSWSLAESSS